MTQSLESLLDDLKAEYKTLKGNELACDREVRNFLVIALTEGSGVFVLDRRLHTGGFHVPTDAEARFTVHALNRLQTHFFPDAPANAFAASPTAAGGYVVKTTQDLALRDKLGEALGNACTAIGMEIDIDEKTLANPTKTNLALRERSFYKLMLENICGRSFDILASATPDEANKLHFAGNDAAVMSLMLGTLYPQWFGGLAQTGKLIEGNLTIPTQMRDKVLADHARAKAIGEQYGGRYMGHVLESWASNSKIPPQFKDLRHFIDTTTGVSIQQRDDTQPFSIALNYHSREALEPILKQCIGSPRAAHALVYDAETHSFTLDAKAGEKLVTRISSVIRLIAQDRFEDAENLVNRYARDYRKAEQIESSPKRFSERVSPANTLAETAQKETTEFMAKFAELDALLALGARVAQAHEPDRFRPSEGRTLLQTQSQDEAATLATLFKEIAGSALAREVSVVPYQRTKSETRVHVETRPPMVEIKENAKVKIGEMLGGLGSDKQEAVDAWNSGDKATARELQEIVIAEIDQLVESRGARAALSREGGRQVA